MTQKEQQLISFAHFLNTNSWIGLVFGMILVWGLVWKGVALWKAARNEQPAWYIVLLLVNTLGILEILYILFFQKNQEQQV